MRYGRREPRGGAPVDPEAFERAVAALGAALEQPGAVGGSRRHRCWRGSRSTQPPVRRSWRGSRSPRRAPQPRSPPPISPGSPTSATSRRRASPPATRAWPRRSRPSLGPAVRLSEPVRRVAWGEERRAGRDGRRGGRGRCLRDRGPGPGRRVDQVRTGAARATSARPLGRIAYGQAAKLLVPLRSAVEPSAVLSVPERYWAWTATGEGGRPMPLVSCFSGSERALEGLGVAEGPERWLESLARLRPELESEPCRRGALALGRRSLGRRRLLGLAAAGDRRGAGATAGAARLRRRAPRWPPSRPDGGRPSKRPRGRRQAHALIRSPSGSNRGSEATSPSTQRPKISTATSVPGSACSGGR